MFSTEIEDETFHLESAWEVAVLSYIAQDSISYLDLELFKNSMITFYFNYFYNAQTSGDLRLCVNTEEKCRQFCIPDRRLLYTLNLDLPKGRESRLKDNSHKPLPYSGLGLHIASIRVPDSFHGDILTDFIGEAFGFSIPKEKILKWLLKTLFCEKPLFCLLESPTASIFIDCFYPENTDSALFNDFIKHFNVVDWVKEYEQPEILEFLLYHARLLGNISLENESDSELINVCTGRYYLNIRPFLNYISDFSLTCSAYVHNLLKISERPLAKDALDEAMESITEKRKCLLEQISWACVHKRPEVASEGLRLIWSSIPDACVTFGELDVAFEEFRDIYKTFYREDVSMDFFGFYVEAVGEVHEHIEPRSLKHLCRTVLRRTFRKNNLWIPDAIRRTGLPKSLQAYLNLEKPFVA